MIKKVSKRELVDTIYERLDKTVSKQIIGSSVSVIYEYIFDVLAEKEALVIPGFGTFCKTYRIGHRIRNIITGEMEDLAPSVSVRFIGHHSLRKMIKERNELHKEFLKNE